MVEVTSNSACLDQMAASYLAHQKWRYEYEEQREARISSLISTVILAVSVIGIAVAALW